MSNAHGNKLHYRELISRLREVVCRALPADATVVVVSRGDEQLLMLDGRRAWHFPQADDGRYAGYHPADSVDAISQLDALEAKGGKFLVVPSTAYWWFNHYAGFKQHLKRRYHLVESNVDTCLIFAMHESKVVPAELVDGSTVDQAIEDAEVLAAIPIEIRQLESAGQVEKACQILRAAMLRIPNSFSLIDEYVRLSISTGNVWQAHDVLLKATTFNYVPVAVQLMLAETSLALGSLDLATNAAERVLEVAPDHVKAGRILSAIQGLRENPVDTGRLVDLVKVEKRAGNLALAEYYATAAIALVPHDYALNLELARLEVRKGLLSSAEQRFTHVVNLRPSEPEILNELMELFCRRIEEHHIESPGRLVDSELLERFLSKLRWPGRNEVLSAETHLRIAETLSRVGQVEPAMASLSLAFQQLDLASESLRDFATRLLQPVSSQELSIPFDDSRALPSFFRQLGNDFAATHETFYSHACFHLAVAADKQLKDLKQLLTSFTHDTPKRDTHDGFSLITCLYNESSTSRIIELLTCLHNNHHNDDIVAIHVLFDDSRDVTPKRLLDCLKELPISLKMIHARPTLRQLFSYANHSLPNRKVIIANSDIYFDDTLKLLDAIDLDNTVLPLTRWNVNKDGTASLLTLTGGWPNYYSADSWVFKTPLRTDFYCEYELGTMLCDSFLNKQLFDAHLSVVNPCLDVKSYHLQAGQSLSQRFQQNDKDEEKGKIWSTECKRNGQRDPIRGVVWSTIDKAVERHSSCECFWKPFNLVLRQNPAAPVDTRYLKKLVKTAENFNRNLWIIDDGLDSSTLAFIKHAANANVNVIERYDVSDTTVKKSRNQDLTKVLTIHCDEDVFVDSVSLNQVDLACPEHIIAECHGLPG